MTDHELQVPLDHAQPGWRADQGLRARDRRAGRARQAVPRLLPGRAGIRGVRARSATRAGRAGCDRALQEFRVLALDQRGTGRSTPVDGHRDRRLPQALPRRLDRARRRAAARGARRRALERPRPELRRLLLVRVPVDRPRLAARGAHHGRHAADRAAGRRRLQRHVGAHGGAQPALLRALPAGPGADAGHRGAAGGRGRAAAERRPPDRAPLPHPRQQARDERRSGGAALHPRAAVRLARVPARRAPTRSASPATRSTRSSTRPVMRTAA